MNGGTAPWILILSTRWSEWWATTTKDFNRSCGTVQHKQFKVIEHQPLHAFQNSRQQEKSNQNSNGPSTSSFKDTFHRIQTELDSNTMINLASYNSYTILVTLKCFLHTFNMVLWLAFNHSQTTINAASMPTRPQQELSHHNAILLSSGLGLCCIGRGSNWNL